MDADLAERLIADPGALLHFVGLAGAGMSALAELRLQEGGRVSGSDRFFDRGEMPDEARRWQRLGAVVLPQDGSGVPAAAAVIASTAVERDIPDLRRARELGRPVLHRSELLAAHVATRRSVAISGTSGKSTVVGMLHAILAGSGRDPAVLTGGELLALRHGDARGNAAAGRGPLVVEADESDRSLVRYRPSFGVVLNLHRDHGDDEDVLAAFQTFRGQARAGFAVADDPRLAGLRANALVFGFGPHATLRGEDLELDPHGSAFSVEGVRVRVPAPGRHNAENALAALAAARLLGVEPSEAAPGLARFAGVHRRFASLGLFGGVEVIDDFAHNPAKIAAALAAAQLRGPRLLAIFQPHGFAPTKLWRRELVEAVAGVLRPDDAFHLTPIFFAGGSAVRDIASDDVAEDLRRLGVRAEAPRDREAAVATIAERARPGDVVLSMGARDPSLDAFARALAAALAARAQASA